MCQAENTGTAAATGDTAHTATTGCSPLVASDFTGDATGTIKITSAVASFRHLSPFVDKRPIEEVAVVGDDDLRSELGDVVEKAADQSLLVGLVEDVERSGERRLRGVLEVLHAHVVIRKRGRKRTRTGVSRRGTNEQGGLCSCNTVLLAGVPSAVCDVLRKQRQSFPPPSPLRPPLPFFPLSSLLPSPSPSLPSPLLSSRQVTPTSPNELIA